MPVAAKPLDSPALKRLARTWGASLVGVADVERLRGIETEPADLLSGFTRAVSLAVRLSDPVLDAIVDRPTPLYAQHYQKVNALLDELALRASLAIQAAGSRALPLPASQLLDAERLTSYLSHKAVAVAAGLGWQGKSLLVVTPQYGPRVRLVTVLTDHGLTPDAPLKNRCGSCAACAEACPAGAIRGASTDSHYASREEALFFERCRTKVLDEFAKLPHITGGICGVCVSACPFGKAAGRKKKR
ncbi:MAG: 4Fe-4S dicluster domain-containing protein [Proteobacteria bacterium]|nr:4Fe-4S dicluster domain-containing protein [Pseudomonadota bacterium]MBU1596021.1 4Fe-4S dicluster domain-containing protein [Pseudomonadota bacterium]